MFYGQGKKLYRKSLSLHLSLLFCSLPSEFFVASFQKYFYVYVNTYSLKFCINVLPTFLPLAGIHILIYAHTCNIKEYDINILIYIYFNLSRDQSLCIYICCQFIHMLCANCLFITMSFSYWTVCFSS